MNNSKAHIAIARFLLTCFIAGQCMVYAHQHNNRGASHKIVFHVPAGNKTLTEKCSLCDALHHAFFEPGAAFYTAFIAINFVHYKYISYSFVNYSLAAAGGRAPPIGLILLNNAGSPFSR